MITVGLAKADAKTGQNPHMRSGPRKRGPYEEAKLLLRTRAINGTKRVGEGYPSKCGG